MFSLWHHVRRVRSEEAKVWVSHLPTIIRLLINISFPKLVDLGGDKFIKERYKLYRPFALTSQILRVSSRCSLTISVPVQQPHTAQELTILIQNYYKLLQNLLCLQKLYYA
jgi:hypothetical protein